MAMKLVSLLSGGKDSTYSTYLAQKDGYEVRDAIIFVPKTDSYMFHRPNAAQAVKIAEAMGLKPIVWETEGIKEKELDDLRKALESVDADGVIAGAIASKYQFERVRRICDSLGLETYTPLWGRDQVEIMREMISEGFRIMVVSVSAYGLGEEWLGRMIDEDALNDLMEIERKYRINVSGEGGEYETMVIDGPNFRHPIRYRVMRKIWKRDHGWIEVRLESG